MQRLLLYQRIRFLWILLPVIVVPHWMIQKIFQKRRPSQSTRQWQMPFGRLLYVVDEFRRSKPTLLAFDFTILRRPANFTAKLFKITLALLPFSLLYRVAKLSARKFVPESLNGSKVCVRDVLYIGKVHKVASFCFGTRDLNESVACELRKQGKKFSKSG